MTFEDVDVHEVVPANVPPTAPSGTWQCCACHTAYPVEEGFKVFYDTVPGVTVVAYVCPACAAEAQVDVTDA